MSGKPPIFAAEHLLAAMLGVLAMVLGANPAAAEDGSGAWKLDLMARVEAGVVTSQTSDADDELVINGDGGYLRGAVGIAVEDDNTEFRVEADRIQVERFGSATGRERYDRDRFTASVSQELGDDWEVTLQGRIYDDLVSIESSDTDEVSAAVRIEYEPVLDHRVRATVTWRTREYADTAGPGSTASQGDGVRVDLDYRYRLGRYHYIGIDTRAEEIHSANPDRGYSRESIALSYTRPITPDLRVRPTIEWRHTQFEGRLTPTGDLREDTALVPEIELLWWPDAWRFELEAKYLFNHSNDPLRDREGYRVSLSVGYVF